ncbi:MAG: hypothetical protein DMF64_07450 [Acidobacteria bacterium]|nr:MAG: hypothetical protein DMF64_07450 [Acidobacteriota bacterium]
MNDQIVRDLETYIRVREFCTAHAAAFPAGTRGHEVINVLNAAITELETNMATQASGKRGAKEGTTLKSVARAALREDLEAINRTARAMALSMPGLEDKFRLPRSASNQGWLAVARSFAQDAAPLKVEFVRRGLPEDFLDQLQASIGEYEQTLNRRTQHKGAHVAATAAINEADERAMNCKLELDAIVRNIFRDDPVTLAEWTSASHVERKEHRRKTAPAPPAPTH